ncbi:MAG: hypothetical protein IKO56_05325 [Alphaproteobacteria bacterium]|nr:hypothetical protein [Alphaproteobacteria bacterium]
MNYVSWFMVLYVISSYLKLYPKRWMNNVKFCGVMFLLSVVISSISILACVYISKSAFYFVADSNALLAVLTGIFAFLFFKNIKLKYNGLINAVASTTFGVLLIHANSDTMRQWLWKDMLDNVGHYGMPFYIIGCVLGVFVVCSLIDLLVKNTIETAFLNHWYKNSERIYAWKNCKENKIFGNDNT